ncbi:MAG: DedA family protein [Actinomycetota bacterium]|nr:DedA family protein [Actinomycetota bacterium]
MSFITNNLLSLSGWTAAFLIFLFPALESSVFLGFVFPGETAVIIGGVLAYEHRISLALAISAAIVGAILGDTVGYFVGRVYGRRILGSKLGRRFLKPDHVSLAESFISRRGGFGVFLGRFAAALRAFVPGLAGMGGMHYPTFLIFNVLGGVSWAVGFTLAGYLAGASFKKVQSYSSVAGYILMAIIILGIILLIVRRKRKERQEALSSGPSDAGDSSSDSDN